MLLVFVLGPSALEWIRVDGSDSVYRQFGNSFERIFPIGNAEGKINDCVQVIILSLCSNTSQVTTPYSATRLSI